MNSGEYIPLPGEPWPEGEFRADDSDTGDLIGRDETDRILSVIVKHHLPELDKAHIYETPLIVSLLQPFHDMAILAGLDKATLWLKCELDHIYGPKQ